MILIGINIILTGFAMSSNVRTYMTRNVRVNMTTNVGLNMTTNVRPTTPNVQPMTPNVGIAIRCLLFGS